MVVHKLKVTASVVLSVPSNTDFARLVRDIFESLVLVNDASCPAFLSAHLFLPVLYCCLQLTCRNLPLYLPKLQVLGFFYRKRTGISGGCFASN